MVTAVIAVSADEASMDEALALAARGRGGTSPNPMVGAVVTQGIISRVWVETPDGWKIARDTWTSAPSPSGPH